MLKKITMKTIICTIGNRDLQFYAGKDAGDLSEYLSTNNDDSKFLIIRKSDYNLYDLTKKIYENYDKYKDIISFPLIEKAIANLPEKNIQLVLIPTNQYPPDPQDTYFIALSARKYFEEKNFGPVIKSIDFNPTDFNRLFTFFTELFDNYTNHDLYCANSGGTPQMKAASEFAGLFRNFNYITINARSETSLSNFKHQEKIVLKHTIEKMLKIFAYEGVISLPVVDEATKKLCEIALARLSLDLKTAKKISDNLDPCTDNYLPETLKKPQGNIDLTKQMYLSAKIKFVQKSYGDYLWRLFSIHDNIFIPPVEKFFNAKIKYCEEDNHSDWNKKLNSKPELLKYLKTRTVGPRNEPLKYVSPNKYVFFEILTFAIAQNHECISREEYELLKEIHIKLDRLGKIRNLIAHNLKGVNIKDIEKKLQNTTITDFNALLARYFKIDADDYCEFDLINNKILERLY